MWQLETLNVVQQEKVVVRRMGLHSASLEGINGKHIIRQRHFFLCNARSALGFAPDSPHSAHITLLHHALLKPAFWFEEKFQFSRNTQILRKKTSWNCELQTWAHPAPWHLLWLYLQTSFVPCPFSRERFRRGNPDPQLRVCAPLCYGDCRWGSLKPKSHPMKDRRKTMIKEQQRDGRNKINSI